MQTRWVAMWAGVLLAVLAASARPDLCELAPVDPNAAGDSDCDALDSADGQVLVRSSFRSGPPVLWPDLRPWWQRQWEELCGPLFPPSGRLYGGIM